MMGLLRAIVEFLWEANNNKWYSDALPQLADYLSNKSESKIN